MLRFVAPALFLLGTGVAFAQTSGIPPEELTNTRRQAGDSITVCVDATGQSRAFDLDVAQAIGDALFLQVKPIEGFGGFPVNGDGFMDELTLAMNNTCDLFMGVSVSTEVQVSEVFSITRPYVTIPFVLAVANSDWQKLGDIPLDQRLGTAMSSIGEMTYITWAQQRAKSERWVRLPYADPDLMATRVLDGTIAGMILWQPTLAKLRADRPDAQKLRTIATDPVAETAIRVGALVSSRDSFLRNQVDQAIDALVADGTIQGLLDKHHYLGHAGE